MDEAEVERAELFDLMFNDHETDSDSDLEAPSSPSPSTSTASPAAFLAKISPCCSVNECSICLCEFDDVVAKLDCGHRFCVNCVGSYLRVQISQAPRLHHKMSIVTREDVALVVNVVELVGLKCPHVSCRQIIDEDKIKAFVDEFTYSKFDRFALDEMLTFMQSKGELNPCPLNCGYFTQEDCLCVNPDCRKRQLLLRKLEEERRKRKEASGQTKFDQWAKDNPDLVRLCPLCNVRIEKNGGCDHMYCSSCKQAFLWSKALPYRPATQSLDERKHLVSMKKLERLGALVVRH